MSNNQQPDPLAVMQALETIEQQLQQLALWQGQAPSDAALASRLPFCVDTLEFHEWLQFVLLVRFRALLAARGEDGIDIPPRNNRANPMDEPGYWD